MTISTIHKRSQSTTSPTPISSNSNSNSLALGRPPPPRPRTDSVTASEVSTWRRDPFANRTKGQTSIYNINTNNNHSDNANTNKRFSVISSTTTKQYLSPLSYPENLHLDPDPALPINSLSHPPPQPPLRPRIKSQTSSFSNLTYHSAASTSTDLTEPSPYPYPYQHYRSLPTPTSIDFSRRMSSSVQDSPSQSHYYAGSEYDSASSRPQRGHREIRPPRSAGLAHLVEMEEDQMRVNREDMQSLPGPGVLSRTTSNLTNASASRVKADKMLGLQANVSLVSAYLCSGLGLVSSRHCGYLTDDRPPKRGRMPTLMRRGVSSPVKIPSVYSGDPRSSPTRSQAIPSRISTRRQEPLVKTTWSSPILDLPPSMPSRGIFPTRVKEQQNW